MAVRKKFKSIQPTNLCVATLYYLTAEHAMHQEHSYSRHLL